MYRQMVVHTKSLLAESHTTQVLAEEWNHFKDIVCRSVQAAEAKSWASQNNAKQMASERCDVYRAVVQMHLCKGSDLKVWTLICV